MLLGRRGWLFEPIFQRLAELELAPYVRIVEGVPNAELPPIYSGALALAFPSLYEGFGLPALEAMACGCPVMTADVASLPEVVGDAGLLVAATDVGAIADALLRLATDPACALTWRRADESRPPDSPGGGQPRRRWPSTGERSSEDCST